MSEYQKKTTGVTSILIKSAHGKNKIHHDSWNNEIEPDKLNKPEKTVDFAPVKAMYICFVIGWLILFIPIPIITYFLAGPLIFASFVMAIICLNKNAIKQGVTGLCLAFVVTPIIYLIGTFISIGMISTALIDALDKDSLKAHNKSPQPAFTQPYKHIPAVTKKVIKSPKSVTSTSTPVSAAKPKPEPEYIYLLTLKSGSIVVANEVKVRGDKLKYKDKNISVTIPKSQLKSYKKIAVK